MDKQLKKTLKAEAHHLKPVVMIGDKGLTPNVQLEVEQALIAHELIKVKINADRELRQQMADQICDESGADLIGIIGHMAIIYRENQDEE